MHPTIDPKKEYSINELQQLRVFGISQVTVLRVILEDVLTDNKLKVTVGGSHTARRYKIKGNNLIKYLEYGKD